MNAAATLALATALLLPVAAVELRVASYNIGAQFTSGGFPDFSLGSPGTPDHDNVLAVLQRIDADVVAVQEIASADLSGAPDDLDALAASAGYPHLYIPPVSGDPPLNGPFDTSLRVVFLSRHPFIFADAIRSPAGTKELTRLHPVVKVDVPGTTNDPVLISAHLKSGTAAADKFRRAIEFRRLTAHLGTLGLTEDDNFIVLGDFNLTSNNATYTTEPANLPASFVRGADMPLPIGYSTNPLAYFTTPSVARLDPRQLNGSAATFRSGSVLDLILVSPALAGRPLQTEIYNSTLDSSNSTGLPKAGSPLATGTSAAASDHYALFADLELDSDFPNLALTVSPAAVTEGRPDGTARLTVTLPAVQATAVTVNLASDAAGVFATTPSVTIPAGTTSALVDIATPRDFLATGDRTVTFTATASGYDPDTALLEVADIDGGYVIPQLAAVVEESFTGFTGGHDPAPWSTTGGLPWRGLDDGSSTTGGLRSYGTGGDGSLGFLSGGTGTVATATYTNATGAPITALRIEADFESWRPVSGGAADRIGGTHIVEGQSTPLGALDFTAGNGGGTRSTVITGLNIPPGAAFELAFSFIPDAAGGPPPSGIFINEFHYDNAGTDAGEFVEVVVGPGFTGDLSLVSLFLYNGNPASAAVTYGSPLLLSSFTLGSTVDGYRFMHYDFPSNGIQNGPNDGFALYNSATSEVLDLISYGGSFTASNGPAAGMTAADIGATQSSSTPVGSSLGHTGAGSAAGDFTWATSTGTNTKGGLNVGQTLTLPGLPPQGIAIDNIRVTAFGPGDTDGDGLADAAELAFGSDPLDGASVFRTELRGAALAFPAAGGITYVVETSTDLEEWEEVDTITGSGTEAVVPLPMTDGRRFFRVSVP